MLYGHSVNPFSDTHAFICQDGGSNAQNKCLQGIVFLHVAVCDRFSPVSRTYAYHIIDHNELLRHAPPYDGEIPVEELKLSLPIEYDHENQVLHVFEPTPHLPCDGGCIERAVLSYQDV